VVWLVQDEFASLFGDADLLKHVLEQQWLALLGLLV